MKVTSRGMGLGRVLPSLLLAVGVFGLRENWHTVGAAVGLDPASTWSTRAIPLLGVVMWLSLGFCLHRLLNGLLWDTVVPVRTGQPTPKLLRDIGLLCVFGLVAVGVLADVFDQPLTGLVTTSGIMLAIIGFALRSMIADVFTGIALGLERPFQINDWIETADGTVGRVVELNWRATRLLTREEVTVVLPNSFLATQPFKNYSRPERFWRDSFKVVLGYDITGYQAERLLLSAVNQVPEITAIERTPEVRIADYTDRGIEWEVRYWVPDYPAMSSLRYRAQRNVMRNLHFSGVNIPKPQLLVSGVGDGAHAQAPKTDLDFLREMELLAPLNDAELAQLAEAAETTLCVAGQPVVTQGESSSCLYLVREGTLTASVADEDGNAAVVGHLIPGSFFGEMSLLTGAAAGATVNPTTDALVIRIGKADLEPVLQARPEVADQLGEVLISRQTINARRIAEQQQDAVVENRTLKERLVSRIADYFNLRPEPVPRQRFDGS